MEQTGRRNREKGNLEGPSTGTCGLRSLGVTAIRTHDFYGPLDMPTLYPDFGKNPLLQSSYVFTSGVGTSAGDLYQWSSDTVFSAIQSAGFEPYFRIGDSYNKVKPPSSETERANWAVAAVQILRHYRTGQWNGFQSTFQYVEIGNEPDNATFWPSPATQIDFFKLYVQTAKAIRAEFPTLRIGGPGLTQNSCASSDTKAWLSGFLDYVKSNGAPLDFLSWHIYSNAPSDVAACAGFVRSTLDGKGLSAVESHLTEWNTDAENKDLAPGDPIKLRADGRGAAILTASWIRLQESKVDQVFHYRVYDPVGGPRSFYGLLDGNYVCKKPGLAFTLWSAFAKYANRVTMTQSGGTSDLVALAAANEQGGYAVLLANTGTTAQTWSVGLPALAAGQETFGTVATVSDAASTVQTAAWDASVSIPAESVQMAILNTAVPTVSLAASNTSVAAGQTLSIDIGVSGLPVDITLPQTRKLYAVLQVGNAVLWLPDLGAAMTPFRQTVTNGTWNAFSVTMSQELSSALRGQNITWIAAILDDQLRIVGQLAQAVVRIE